MNKCKCLTKLHNNCSVSRVFKTVNGKDYSIEGHYDNKGCFVSDIAVSLEHVNLSCYYDECMKCGELLQTQSYVNILKAFDLCSTCYEVLTKPNTVHRIYPHNNGGTRAVQGHYDEKGAFISDVMLLDGDTTSHNMLLDLWYDKCANGCDTHSDMFSQAMADGDKGDMNKIVIIREKVKEETEDRVYKFLSSNYDQADFDTFDTTIDVILARGNHGVQDGNFIKLLATLGVIEGVDFIQDDEEHIRMAFAECVQSGATYFKVYSSDKTTSGLYMSIENDEYINVLTGTVVTGETLVCANNFSTKPLSDEEEHKFQQIVSIYAN